MAIMTLPSHRVDPCCGLVDDPGCQERQLLFIADLGLSSSLDHIVQGHVIGAKQSHGPDRNSQMVIHNDLPWNSTISQEISANYVQSLSYFLRPTIKRYTS